VSLRRRQPQDEEESRRVAARLAEGEQAIAAVRRARDALRSYQQAGGAFTKVNAQHILDLLDEDGEWSRPFGAEGPDPGADPLTGCSPVTAPGRD
jgi:hypothetical protein